MPEEEEEEKERIYTIPLRFPNLQRRTKRSPRAIKYIKEYIARHMKVEEEDVWIDPGVNEYIWIRGIQKPPKSIKVKAIKFKEGFVEVSLPE